MASASWRWHEAHVPVFRRGVIFPCVFINLRSKKFILVSILIIFFAVAEIWVNNSLAKLGGQFESTLNLQKSLMLENQLLENEIATEASLQKIASQSASLGFIKPLKVQYIR